VRLSGDIVEACTRRVYFLTTRVKQREGEEERVTGQVIKNFEKGEKKIKRHSLGFLKKPQIVKWSF